MKTFFRTIMLFSAGLLLGVVLLHPVNVLAANDPNSLSNACKTPGVEGSTACTASNDQTTELYGQNGILTKTASIMAWVAGVTAVVMIMVAGFKYIIASGDSSNISSAKNTLLYALIGLSIAITAQAIVIFVLKRL